MKGYDFESSKIADTIKGAKENAFEFSKKISGVSLASEEYEAIKNGTVSAVVELSEALDMFKLWQNKLNTCLIKWVEDNIAQTLESAVHEYGVRNNENWLTKVSLAKLGISYTDSLCDTENRCLSALCDTLTNLYNCKKTIDAAKANKRLIHANTVARLKKMHEHYNVKITYSLAKAILTEETNLVIG